MKYIEQIVDEKEIFTVVKKFLSNENKTAIIGGHYILLYEKKSDSLKPAIYQDFNDWGNMMWSKKRTQNFPVKSFEMTVKLYDMLNQNDNNQNVKCVLLVNDDLFHKKEFRGVSHYETVSNRSFELRKKYFETIENIPRSFKKILKKYNLNAKDFFLTFDSKGYRGDKLLPTSTIFVSERLLCKSFKKNIRRRNKFLESKKLFDIIKIDESGMVQELSVKSNLKDSLCLIDNGFCNCGGKSFQFYFELIKKGFENIVFFVPNECKSQVLEGAKLICNAEEFNNQNIIIINISNIESNPDFELFNEEIEVCRISNI